jgi:REase_MTES_1575
LAERQHGVVAHRQLVELGLLPCAIQRRIAAGLLHPVYRGAYAVGHRRLSRHGRWMAAVLACGPTALLSHGSAAALQSILLTSGSAIDVVTARRTRHNRAGIALHRPRRLHPEDCAVEDGIPVTSISRTLLDLAEVVQRRQLRRALEESDRLGRFDLRAVERLIGRSKGHRGLGRLKATVRDYRGPAPITRSGLERRFLDLCHVAGLPRPQANVLVRGYEVDVAWLDQRLIVELDSRGYHGTRAAFENDRIRDATLQAAGYRAIRITHRRMEAAPAEVVQLLRALLSS